MVGLVLALGASAAAQPQPVAPAEDGAPGGRTIVVYREELEASGLASVGDILQRLPWLSNGLNVQANGSPGTTRLNLRGLETGNTLILVNGRRFVPGGLGLDLAADLNAIPLEMVERVEIHPGAGAVRYGSGAVAGLIDIITYADFDGAQASAQLGGSVHGGSTFRGGLRLGAQSEQGSVQVGAQYYRQTGLRADQRDFSGTSRAFDAETGDLRPVGSSAGPNPLLIDRLGDPGNSSWSGLQDRLGRRGSILFNDPSVGWRPARLTGNSDEGEGDFYNFAGEEYLVAPSERISLFGSGRLSLFADAELFAEALYTHRTSEARSASTPLFTAFEGPGLELSADSVYNPFGRAFLDVRRRLVEAGPRVLTTRTDTFQGTAGVRGRFPELGPIRDWTWELSYGFGRTQALLSQPVLLSRRLAQALGPSFIGESLRARCGDPTAPIQGCVPLNLLGGEGTITAEQLAFFTGEGLTQGFTEQHVATLETGAELFRLWGQAARLGLGAQYRQMRGGTQPDVALAGGETTFGEFPAFEGAFRELAAFAHITIPVLADLPGVALFEVFAGARAVDFDTFGGELAVEAGGRWHIVEGLTIRGQFARGFRAPSLGESFAPSRTSPRLLTEPCNTPTPQARINCEADGVSNTLDRDSFLVRFGGNPDVGPERSNILSAGLTWSPVQLDLLRGLSLGVDYFFIEQTGMIVGLSPQLILEACYEAPPEARAYCDRVTRDPNGSFITQVDTRVTNEEGFVTSGLDLSARYRLDSPFGHWLVFFDAVHTFEYYRRFADGGEISGLDQYATSPNGAVPSWRYNAGLRWEHAVGIGAGSNLRYIGGMRECYDDCQRDANSAVRGVGPNVTLDVFATLAFATTLGRTALQLGINNLTDVEPPLLYRVGANNADPNNYDFGGRFLYASLSQRL